MNNTDSCMSLRNTHTVHVCANKGMGAWVFLWNIFGVIQA